MANEDGVWRTIGGRRIFIKTGQNLSSAMKESGKFKIKNKKKETKTNSKNQIITQEEKNKKMIEIQNESKRLESERDKKNEKLKQLYNDGKIDNDKYDEEWLKINDEYRDKSQELGFKSIYDEKKDNYMTIEKDDIFYDESKDYLKKEKPSNTNEFTDQEKDSLYKYTTSYGNGSYNQINPHLYGENVFSEKSKVEENIANIDSAMQKSKIGGNYQLYRSIEPSKIGDENVAKTIEKINKAVKKGGGKNLEELKTDLESLKGQTIENKGFVSTSTFLDSNYAQRGVTFVIDTKPTDRAIDIRSLSAYNGGRDKVAVAFSKGTIQTESEILYDRNTNFKIKDVAITDKGVLIHCDTEQKNNLSSKSLNTQLKKSTSSQSNDNWIEKAFNEYKQEHPNSKMTIGEFKKNNEK